MDAHLQASRDKVITHLQNAFLHLGSILGIYNVFFEVVLVYSLGFLFIGKHQESLVVPAKDVVDVDAHQNLDFADVAQFLAQFEVARRAEKAHDSQKAVEGSHLRSNATQLIEQGVAVSVVEKLCAHSPWVAKADGQGLQ